MKASIKFFAAGSCITAWLLACGSYFWKTVENTKKGPKPASRVAAEFTNALGMKFVLIPAGTFITGSPLNEPGRDSDERRHKVTLTRPFYMQTTEVTQGQWQAVMGDNPSHFRDCGETCPVEMVSWHDTQTRIDLNRWSGRVKIVRLCGSMICDMIKRDRYESSLKNFILLPNYCNN